MIEMLAGLILLGPRPLDPPGFERDLAALAVCESSNRTGAVNRTGKYRGLYQFDLPTWESVGGIGDPAATSRYEQTHRAKLLYQKRGWQPWPQCAAKLELKDRWR